jgi:hypothetical protein
VLVLIPPARTAGPDVAWPTRATGWAWPGLAVPGVAVPPGLAWPYRAGQCAVKAGPSESANCR